MNPMDHEETIMWPRPKSDWLGTITRWIVWASFLGLCVWALSCSLHVHLKDIHYHGKQPQHDPNAAIERAFRSALGGENGETYVEPTERD